MTASSVASVKVEVEQLEQLARALGVPLPATGSGASLFRLCLARSRKLIPVIEIVDRLEAIEALEGLRNTFQRALGGTGEADATAEAERAPAPPGAC